MRRPKAKSEEERKERLRETAREYRKQQKALVANLTPEERLERREKENERQKKWEDELPPERKKEVRERHKISAAKYRKDNPERIKELKKKRDKLQRDVIMEAYMKNLDEDNVPT